MGATGEPLAGRNDVMTDMWTDDEIADLFASANPIPTGRVTEVRRGGHGATGRESLPASLDLGDRPLVPADEGHHERWWLVVGVAAAVALVVSLLVTTTVDDTDPVPADEPEPTVPEPPVAEPSASVAIVESFIDAVARHDLDAAEAVVAPGENLVISIGSTLPDGSTADLVDQFTFLEATGWWWEVERCNDIADDHVWCRVRHHDRLTDHAGVEATGTAEFWLSDEMIRDARVQAQLDDYGTDAVEPFLAWVADQYPDDVDRMVIDYRGDLAPILNDESASLFDAHLTEYIGSDTATRPVDADSRASDDLEAVERFIEAFNDRDLAAMELVSTEDLVLEYFEFDELPLAMEWYEVVDWRWEDASCEVAEVGVRTWCQLSVRSRLTDLTHFETGAHVLFLMNNGAIETVDETPDLVRLTVGGDSPFGDWVVANHPGDFERIWNIGTGRGDRGPILDEQSIALFDAHLTEYIDDQFSDESRIDLVLAFIEAFSQYAAAPALDLTTPEAQLAIAPGSVRLGASDSDAPTSSEPDSGLSGMTTVDLASQFGWLEAFGWRWEDAECTVAQDRAVTCAYRTRNRLTERVGAEMTGRATFTFHERSIDRITSTPSDSGGFVELLDQFAVWLADNHPADVDLVNSPHGPDLTAEAAEILDNRLTEYESVEDE